MSYYRGYDYEDDRGYGGYGDGYRSRYDDFRERDRYGGRPDRDRRGGGGGGGRRDGGYDRRSGGYEGRRDDFDRRRDEYGRRREGYGGGGGGGGGRRDGSKSGWGGGGGGRRDDRRGGFRGRGRGGRENGGRGRGNKRSFGGGGGRGGSAKRPRLTDIDNWGKSDRHSIMESHFLEAVPNNFQDEWLCIACPAGKRSLLVAANNMTQLYTKEGQPDLKFKSCLPNGSHLQNEVMKYHDLTILDSVYCPEKKKIYILDLLHWKHFPYYETEAEFRTYFLPQKFALLKNPGEVSENNEVNILLHFHALKMISNQVEGLLFINKKSTYECSDSPNSLFLRLDQLEKFLGVSVPEGVTFTETSPNDARWKEELEERKKVQAAREQAAKEAKEAREKEREAREKEKEAKAAEGGEEAEVSAGGDAAPTEEYNTEADFVGTEYASTNEYAAEGEYATGGGDYPAGGEYATEGEYATAGGDYTAGGGEYAAPTEESYPAGGEYSTGENYSEGWSTGGDNNAYSTSNFYG
ncbi:unnamed protein product [Candidula unifasciata]|uniref:Snurportin-1 n=1 Tax=Candidula unifasciata TaxID=100452 RepID=A0A8S3YNQ1_9EUPU|nr:unnamed protein product [Candidula unifasciata]